MQQSKNFSIVGEDSYLPMMYIVHWDIDINPKSKMNLLIEILQLLLFHFNKSCQGKLCEFSSGKRCLDQAAAKDLVTSLWKQNGMEPIPLVEKVAFSPPKNQDWKFAEYGWGA